jgi:gas vesicle protein
MREARCFFFGLGVGVAAGVLMAPRTGARTRERIAAKAREGQEYIKREGMGLRDSAVDKLNRTRRAVQVTSEGIGTAFQEGKEELVG